jgi:Flp pilus assembly pilin Flp
LRKFIWTLLFRVPDSERGVVYVEYVVLGALATLVILGTIQYFFGAISALFQRIGSALSGL